MKFCFQHTSHVLYFFKKEITHRCYYSISRTWLSYQPRLLPPGTWDKPAPGRHILHSLSFCRTRQTSIGKQCTPQSALLFQHVRLTDVDRRQNSSLGTMFDHPVLLCIYEFLHSIDSTLSLLWISYTHWLFHTWCHQCNTYRPFSPAIALSQLMYLSLLENQ